MALSKRFKGKHIASITLHTGMFLILCGAFFSAQFTSVLEIDGKILETSVNHPCKYKGYRFYQADYDRLNCKYSVLILVKDPWLPIVFIGMILMALGSILAIKKLSSIVFFY